MADIQFQAGILAQFQADDGMRASCARSEVASSDLLLRLGNLCAVCGAPAQLHPALNLSSCPDCHHVFQTDMAVTVSYDADYAHQYDHRPVKAMSDLRWNFIQAHLALPRASRVLDVGYGNGAFLHRARAAGMDIYGIDVHQEDFGVPVIDFDTDIYFYLVSFFDSLEHFPEFAPIGKLRSRCVIVSIQKLPDFILITPMLWRHFKPGERLHYFSTSSLDKFMHNWGFPCKIAEGFPEDDLRGKLRVNDRTLDNIYTAIYACS